MIRRTSSVRCSVDSLERGVGRVELRDECGILWGTRRVGRRHVLAVVASNLARQLPGEINLHAGVRERDTPVVGDGGERLVSKGELGRVRVVRDIERGEVLPDDVRVRGGA
jgi:hypothetical protein